MRPIQWAIPVSRLDLGKLADALQQVEAAGCNELHFDVRDGRFTPDFGLGLETLAAVRTASKLPIHVHLQIEQPDRHIERFAESGCTTLSVHAEACLHAPRTLDHIRELGMKPGIALNAATPLTRLEYLLPHANSLLLLLQDPGSSSAEVPAAAFERLKILRENLDYEESQITLQAKGAISPEDAPRLIECGTDTIVLDLPELAGGDLGSILSPYSGLGE